MRYLITAILLMALNVGCPAQESSDLSTEVKSLLVEAQGGDTEAQLRVATAYDWGQGAPRSGSEATKWYTLAAQGGSAEAQNSLGSIFQADGHFSDALKWYRLAAKQEHALAINNLADLYNLGHGVAQDRARALELFTLSAELGWDEAMWNIANMYGAGHIGGEKNFLMACVWASRAIMYPVPGNAVSHRAEPALAFLESKLSRKERIECQHMSKAWKPHKPAV